MTPVLWHKFPDEAVADQSFSPEEQRKLERVFAADKTSPWQQALRLLHLKAPDGSMIRWYEGRPYINWTSFIAAISGGMMVTNREPGGHYTLSVQYSLRGIWRMIASQWSISKYMHRLLPAEPALADSLVLGLVLQSLLIRLGPHAANLPRYLADPDNAPAACRKTLKELQAVQMQRTRISHVWKDIMPAGNATASNAPDYFWDDTGPAPLQPQAKQAVSDTWKGQSVCAGIVTGIAVAVNNTTPDAIAALKSQYNAPIILVFRTAQPDTTLLFPYADGLAFCTGGVLSHACTVARESHIPAVTALGADFFDNVPQWLTLDGAAGTVRRV